MNPEEEIPISPTLPRSYQTDEEKEDDISGQKNIEKFQNSISTLQSIIEEPYNMADIDTIIKILTEFNEENSKTAYERQIDIELPQDTFCMLNDLISIPDEKVGFSALQALNIISNVFKIHFPEEYQEQFFTTVQHYLESDSIECFLSTCTLLTNLFQNSDVPLDIFPLYNIIIDKAQNIEGPGIVKVLSCIHEFVKKYLLKGNINLNMLFPFLSGHVREQDGNDDEVLETLKIISYCFMSNYPGTVSALKNTQIFIFLSALSYSSNPKIIESALRAIGFAIANFNCPELFASDLDFDRLISLVAEGVAVAEAAPCIAAIIDKKADDGTISVPTVIESFISVASRGLGFMETCAVIYMLTKAVLNAGEGDLESIDLPTVVSLLGGLLGVGNCELEEQVLEALLTIDAKAKSINQGEAFAEIVGGIVTVEQLDDLIANSSEEISEMAEQVLAIIQPECE